VSDRISVRTRFERFPATLKGAFILRGEDRDPHQVILQAARTESLDGRVQRALPVGEATLDIVPRRDLFVPFEVSVSDLDPGWYELVCDLRVDGVSATYRGDRRFAVAWPRASVRRGRVEVGERFPLGPSEVRIGDVECTGDSIRVELSVTPPSPVTARLSADGARHEILSMDLDQASGVGRIVAYPLLKVHRELRIELRGHGRGAEGGLVVPLP
jgi:hypothetical protein